MLDGQGAGDAILEELEQASQVGSVLGPFGQPHATQLHPRVLCNGRAQVQLAARVHHLQIHSVSKLTIPSSVVVPDPVGSGGKVNLVSSFVDTDPAKN